MSVLDVSGVKDADLISRWTGLSRSDVVILHSPVGAAELWAGARPAEHEALTNLFRVLECVPIDEATGRQAGDYLRRYRKSHAVELGGARARTTLSITLWHLQRPGADPK